MSGSANISRCFALRYLWFVCFCFLGSVVGYSSVHAQTSGKASTSNKEAPYDWIAFDTTQGTWIHFDVSPDGKQIVFDLLGDLYLLPITGGKAEPLTTGTAYDVQPSWSPDGQTILFTSDRDGGNDPWVLHVKTRKMRQITRTKWINSNKAIWTPDGQYVVYRKRITDRRSIGVVELWMVHLWGGRGIQLTQGNDIGDANDPSFSRDGRYLYFAARGRHVYNRNPHEGIWNVMRLDMQTREKLLLTRNASCPTPSPQGHQLAIVRRVGSKTAILLHDLRTGQESLLVDNLDRDQHEGFAMNGTYPSLRWSADGQFIFYSAQGHFWKVSIRTGKPMPIRFVAKIRQKVTRALQVTTRIQQTHFSPRILRWVKLHPSHRWILWNALSKTWVASWPKVNNPRPLLPDQETQFAPNFSADGNWLTYVTWNDRTQGHVWIRAFRADGTVGPARRITRVAGYYNNPSLSPDNRHITFVQASGSQARGLPNTYQPWLQLVHVDLVTGKTNSLVYLPSRGVLGRMPHPQFSRDGRRIYFTRTHTKAYRSYTTLCSIRTDGTEEYKHLKIYAAEDMIVSPDEQWVTFQQLHQVYVSILPKAQKTAVALQIPDGQLGGSTLPVLRLSKTGGSWPQWGSNSLLTWSLANDFYTLPLSEVRKTLERNAEKALAAKPSSSEPAKTKQASKKESSKTATASSGSTTQGKHVGSRALPTSRPVRSASVKQPQPPQPAPIKAAGSLSTSKLSSKPPAKQELQPTKTRLHFEVPVARPTGCYALTGLRLVTMRGSEVIPQGTLVIRDAQIADIGTSQQVKIPPDCKVFPMNGKTATPGFVDVHAHLHYTTLPVYPQHHWEHYVNLAYGVTTVFDPSAPTEFVLAVGEKIRAGLTAGPRVYSTGFILYGAENTHKAVIHNLKQAQEHLRRMKRLGALGVKSYMQPTRQQRQWVMQAAREEQLIVVPEGGGNMTMNLTMILDGHTGIEHALPITPLYHDVIQLFARSKTGYTPTLLVAYGGISGEVFFLQSQSIWNDPKLRRFFPPRLLAARGRRTSIHVHDNDWNHTRVARYAHAIVQAGGQVQIGSHGQLQGQGYHWELMALRQGGMSNHHVLRAATLHGARYIGLQEDIGSLERGKLADIAIFDKNPLQSLRHLKTIRWVIKQGYGYEAATMRRIWPSVQPRPVFSWFTPRIRKHTPTTR